MVPCVMETHSIKHKVVIVRMHLGRAGELRNINQRNVRFWGKKKSESQIGVLRESILGVHEPLPSEVQGT